jgi:hypothetical protein
LGICLTYSRWAHTSFIGFSFAGFDRETGGRITLSNLSGYRSLKVRFQAPWPKILS